MATLQKGDDERVANSPYVINSLKAHGYVDVNSTPTHIPVKAPDDNPVKIKVKTKKGGKKS